MYYEYGVWIIIKKLEWIEENSNVTYFDQTYFQKNV